MKGLPYILAKKFGRVLVLAISIACLPTIYKLLCKYLPKYVKFSTEKLVFCSNLFKRLHSNVQTISLYFTTTTTHETPKIVSIHQVNCLSNKRREHEKNMAVNSLYHTTTKFGFTLTTANSGQHIHTLCLFNLGSIKLALYRMYI